MINSELLSILAAQRSAELLATADRSRLAAAARPRRPLRLRRGRVIVEIHLSADVRPEQIDHLLASVARHLGTT